MVAPRKVANDLIVTEGVWAAGQEYELMIGLGDFGCEQGSRDTMTFNGRGRQFIIMPLQTKMRCKKVSEACPLQWLGKKKRTR
jgi:hypothetical protein